jgi:molecular chaperone GrpE
MMRNNCKESGMTELKDGLDLGQEQGQGQEQVEGQVQGIGSRDEPGMTDGSGMTDEPMVTDEADADAVLDDDADDAAPGGEVEVAKVDDAETKYLRLAADFQNYKRRTEEDKSKTYAYANEKFSTDLLEVVDNFERAISQDNIDGADAKFIEGMELILVQLRNVLTKNGVEEIEAEGAEFDPNLHHAVMTEPATKKNAGKVTEVLQKGYRLKDRVIRPAMVKVAQ